MTRFESPRVAVIGAGETGRGWAALCIGAGWAVTLYEPDGEVLRSAEDAITERVQSLVNLRRAEAQVAEDALNQMRIARSLLQAVGDAGWVIEAVPEELQAKVKVLHLIEQVARRAAIITSSSSSFGPSALMARLEHPGRFLVAHPIHPVELIPLVELVPGPQTDPEAIEDVRFWLNMLGRAPVVLKKEVPGNLAGRLTAALWRECIQLVIDGVLDVEDVDRAVQLGPALAWTAGGPHLEHHLASGAWGLEGYLSQQLGTYEGIWKSLATWTHLEPEERQRLIRAVDKAYSEHIDQLRQARDQRLARLLDSLNG